MRRKDREIADLNQIRDILEKADVLHIALNNGNFPYILPVNFGFYMTENGKLTLFFHGAKEGAKHEIIQKDNRVSFEVDCLHKLLPAKGEESCTASFAYASVIGQGVIEKADESEKENLLIALLNHYGITSNKFSPVQLKNTLVYKITAASYTAKEHKR